MRIFIFIMVLSTLCSISCKFGKPIASFPRFKRWNKTDTINNEIIHHSSYYYINTYNGISKGNWSIAKTYSMNGKMIEKKLFKCTHTYSNNKSFFTKTIYYDSLGHYTSKHFKIEDIIGCIGGSRASKIILDTTIYRKK